VIPPKRGVAGESGLAYGERVGLRRRRLYDRSES
jgi:hypothetical protein